MDLADLLEIERARVRAAEEQAKREARVMAFHAMLHTGKTFKEEDFLGQPPPENLTEEEQERRAKILAAYRNG